MSGDEPEAISLGEAVFCAFQKKQFDGIESPIEDWFSHGFAAHMQSVMPKVEGATFAVLPPGTNDRPAHFVLIPQFKIHRYRYDFAIGVSSDRKPIMLVECDSKQFHPSAEAKANDAAKDAIAEKYGIELMRITGGKIHHERRKIVRLVIEEFVRAAHSRCKKDFRWLVSAP